MNNNAFITLSLGNPPLLLIYPDGWIETQKLFSVELNAEQVEEFIQTFPEAV